ncbi:MULTISPECIES: hypothetical protein [unclassified Endozoicomonas]|uniref:hypothetical protein n=1 Tax=unclassified Endozoicomonas TaxID=2644528 RepID=UPI003BAE6B60
MNKADNNSGIVGLFSLKPKEETPKGVSFGRTTMAADKVDSSLSHFVNGSDTGHSSQRLGTLASTSTLLEQRVVSNQVSTEIVAAKKRPQMAVSKIINHLDDFKTKIIAEDEYCRNKAHTRDIQVLENIIQLLQHLEPCKISVVVRFNVGAGSVKIGDDFFSTVDFNVYYRGQMLFSLLQNTVSPGDTRNPVKLGARVVETSALFDELYFAPGGPGYQAAKCEFEVLQIKSLLDGLKGLPVHE